ncbi:hypothetical protein [Sulfitobacter sp. R18_1]|uniref:hypothetical protein n=1 Tax=Sulfitobacter sp. R18_1 TaxID=2821104 RepID=UPI001ADA230A|nr:hypothetical protein [Sulfitobacter sp. R18_1]MBO9428501.1 hypothetical protein [Sulfitobacter sp. R18_1]
MSVSLRTKNNKLSSSNESGVIEKDGHFYYHLVIRNKDGEKAKSSVVKLDAKPETERAIEKARTKALGKLIHESIKTGNKDWSGLVLSDLNFSEATEAYTGKDQVTDLSYFDFSNCLVTSHTIDGPGTTFKNTKLDRAVFDNVIAGTFDIRGSTSKTPVSMCGINVQELLGSGSDLFNPLLRGARIKKIDLINTTNETGKPVRKPTTWIAPLLSQAEISGGTIEYASLKNGDWGSCVSIGLDARGADLSDTTRDDINRALARGMNRASELTLKAHDIQVDSVLKSKDFPNKVRGAVFVNLRINKETELNGMNRRALQISNAVRMVSKVGFTTAAFLLMATVDVAGFGWVDGATSSLGSGSLIAVSAALDFMKSGTFEDIIGSRIKKRVEDVLVGSQKAVVWNARTLRERMRNLRVVWGGKEAMEPLMRAMQVVSKDGKKVGKSKSLFRALKGDGDTIIVCDKKMLTKAISNISSNRKRKYSVKKDVTLARVGAGKNNLEAASTLTFHKTGNKSLSFLIDDQVILVTTSDDQKDPTCINIETGSEYPLSKLESYGVSKNDSGVYAIDKAIDKFERAVLDENGLKDFSYDSDTSYVTSSQNGRTLLVCNRNTREVHSREGAALVHLDKSAIKRDDCWVQEYFIGGELKTKDEFNHSNRLHKRRDRSSNISTPSKIEESLRAVKKSFQEQFAKTGRLSPAQMKAQENIERSLSRLSM